MLLASLLRRHLHRTSSFVRVILGAVVLGNLMASSVVAAVDPVQLRHAQEKLWSWQNAEATAEFAALEKIDPRNAEVQRSLGALALRTERWEESVQRMERALELDPALERISDFQCELGDSHGLLAAHGSVFVKLGHAKKCRLAYEKAVELDPSSVRAHWSLLEFYRQAPGFLGGSMEKSYAQAQIIKELNPSRGRFAHALVLNGDKKAEEAFALFQGVSPADSQDYAALVQLGQLTILSGLHLDRGVAAFRRSLDLPAARDEPEHKVVHFFIGQLLDRQGNASAARDAYQAALALDPKFQPAITALTKKS